MANTIAIITVFYPNTSHLENVRKIAEQVNKVIICDNSPENNLLLFKSINNLQYCFWGENLGLSLGFNKILKNTNFAWQDDDFIIFFDQDTKIPEKHIVTLEKDYEWLEKKNYAVGCVGPVFFNESMQKTEIPTLKKVVSDNIIAVKSMITSSMLCKYKNLRKIGFWNEEIFLDMADWDICWRFRYNGMSCFMTNATIIHHTVGEGKKRIFGFFDLRIAKPFREYYQTRDCLYLFWKKYIPWNFRMRFILRLTVRNVLHIFFLDEPMLRLQYIIQGIRDYINNIHGVLNLEKEV
ncbi:MAG: hypothetical protein Q4E64_10550 [Phascolarctobacterium sp.]|uniref:hypothetical protein n=1 Tax=Phascolarctobacterium sp. TaxID=2049039 RepID=UPI0026DD28F9|nr:hypothetical protein [Phascolarctobacterium sp.]MDO4922245.1 hypothetical protein [Phascolarctobacterium sp.]